MHSIMISLMTEDRKSLWQLLRPSASTGYCEESFP